MKEALITAEGTVLRENALRVINPDIFRKYFPFAQIKIADTNKPSSIAVDPFKLGKGNFNFFLLVCHNSGEVTCAVQHKTLISLLDLDPSGNKQGNGIIELSSKPFAKSFYTEESCRKRGLGRRRLLLMNALSQMLYGLPLDSGTIIPEPLKRLFEGLLKEGKVEKYKDGEQDRYVFADTLINLMKKLDYSALPPTSENEQAMEFIRAFKRNNNRYPRFHIVLEIPIHKSKFGIISFHIDRSRHKTCVDISKKDLEVKRMIEILEEGKHKVVQDSLLELFRYELLTGNVREADTKGVSQDGRLKELLKEKKRVRLKGWNRRGWIKRRDKPDDPLGIDESY